MGDVAFCVSSCLLLIARLLSFLFFLVSQSSRTSGINARLWVSKSWVVSRLTVHMVWRLSAGMRKIMGWWLCPVILPREIFLCYSRRQPRNISVNNGKPCFEAQHTARTRKWNKVQDTVASQLCLCGSFVRFGRFLDCGYQDRKASRT